MSVFKGRLVSVISRTCAEDGIDITWDKLVSKYSSTIYDDTKLSTDVKLNNVVCEFDFDLGAMKMFICLDKTILEIPISDIKVMVNHNNPNDSTEPDRWFNIIRCISKPDARYDILEFIISTDISDKLNFIWSYAETDRTRIKVHFNMAVSTEEVVEWWKLTYDRDPQDSDDKCVEWIYDGEGDSLTDNLWVHPVLPDTISDYIDISDTWIIEFTGINKRVLPKD